MKSRFTRIKGRYSEARILPRIGRIRLGIKVKSSKGTEYPKETEYFVVPPEVAAVYDEKPTELDVMFPLDDEEIVFPQKLAMYGLGAGLKCHGNGEEALCRGGDGEWKEVSCPCDQFKTAANPRGQCTEVSSLMVMLPRVSMGGCYQINTGSEISTKNVNSSIDLIRAVVGRISLVPLKLRRVPTETHHDGGRQTHYTLSLVLDGNAEQIRKSLSAMTIANRYQIEAPTDDNPELDPTDKSHEIESQIFPRTELAETRDHSTQESDGSGEPPPIDAAPSGSIESQLADFQGLDEAQQINELLLLIPKKLPEEKTKGLGKGRISMWAKAGRISYFHDLLERPDLQPVSS